MRHAPAVGVALVTVYSIFVLQTPATTYPSVGYAKLEGLKALEGKWTLDGKWANGNQFKGRQTIEPMLGGKFVSVRTWSASGDVAETERDLVVYGLDDKLELAQWVYTPDGQVRRTTRSATYDGSIQFDWTKTDANGKQTELRTVLNFVDANTYRWRTQMHIKGEWHTLIDGQWKRQK